MTRSMSGFWNGPGKRGYRCGPECYERYVVDYWTTREPAEFVTEVIVPVTKAVEAGNIPL